MKEFFMMLILVLLVSCDNVTGSDQGGRSGQDENPTTTSKVKLDQSVSQYSWRRTISCAGAECTFEAVIFGTDVDFVSLISYTKEPVDSTAISATLGESHEDFEATGTMSGIATDRTDPLIKKIISLEWHSVGRLNICINGSCGIYDQLNSGDL